MPFPWLSTDNSRSPCCCSVAKWCFTLCDPSDYCTPGFAAATTAAKSLQLCPTLCNPIDGSPPGSPVLGILQARTLEWVAISFSNVWKWKVKSEREVAQSCLTLSDPMDCSLPGSAVHGIFQARVLGWGAIALSFNTSWSLLKLMSVELMMPCNLLILCCPLLLLLSIFSSIRVFSKELQSILTC